MRLRKLDSFEPALDGGSGGDRLRETNKDGAGPWYASDCLQPLVRHSKGLPWGDFNGGSYLRISCREEVISLPTHRSTARGQSHLQCRSREAGGGGRRGRFRVREVDGKEGVDGRAEHWLHPQAPPLTQMTNHSTGFKDSAMNIEYHRWHHKPKSISIQKAGHEIHIISSQKLKSLLFDWLY